MHRFYFFIKFVVFFFVSICLNFNALIANESVTDTIILQLKWKHQFQFAGYYAAIEQGYYRELGLEVIIKESNGEESVDVVLAGDADYGITSTDLLQAYGLGKPVVLLANIYQHSPLVFVAEKRDFSTNVHDIEGEKIMLESHAKELLAYLKYEQIETQNITFIPHDFSGKALLNKDVFAMSAYITDELYILDSASFDYVIFNPRSSGIDFYGDVIYTTNAEINNNPKRVKKFLKASFLGWKYAIEHKEEIIQLIYNKYSKRHSIEHLRFEAEQTERLIMHDVVEIGYINKERWKRIAEIYAEMKIIPKNINIDDFIYNPSQKIDSRKYYLIILISVLLLVIISFIAFKFYILNKKLKKETQIIKIKEKEVHALERKYRNLAEYAPYPILISEIETGKILYVNNLAYQMFKIDKKHLVKLNVLNFYYDKKDKEYIVNELKKRNFINEKEVLMKNSENETFWTLISSTRVEFNNNEAAFSAIIDISQRINLENNLKSLNKTKDKFFSIIAHDLRGPIGNLKSFLEFINKQKDTISEENLYIYLNELQESSSNIYNLLENLLTWSKSQKGEIQFIPEKENISYLIRMNVNLLQTQANNKNIKIINNCEENIYIDFDYKMIDTVIRNILSNSLKYSFKGGTVVINSFKKHDGIEISITDNGLGMNKQKLHELNEPNIQNQSVDGTSGEKGTGLGLMLCKDFIKKHKGMLMIESEKGVGSKFMISLPMRLI